jgi:hypothetical protein
MAISSVDLVPGLIAITPTPFFISIGGYSPTNMIYSLVGLISLQEGAIFILDLVFWSGRSLPIAMRLSREVSYFPIYTLTVVFNGLEAISLEAEFA